MTPVEETQQEDGSSQQALADDTSLLHEVEEITDVFKGTETETSLTERVEYLRASLESIGDEVKSWRGRGYYVEAIENLKYQVDEIHTEWDTVSATLATQRERLESLLQAFPGVIETSTLRALSLRVSHLEQLVSEMVEENHAKSTSDKARKQLAISVAALVLTVVFWGGFLGISLLR